MKIKYVFLLIIIILGIQGLINLNTAYTPHYTKLSTEQAFFPDESNYISTNNTNFIVEIGSGKVLTGMNKRIDRKYESLNVSNLEEADIFFKRLKEII